MRPGQFWQSVDEDYELLDAIAVDMFGDRLPQGASERVLLGTSPVGLARARKLPIPIAGGTLFLWFQSIDDKNEMAILGAAKKLGLLGGDADGEYRRMDTESAGSTRTADGIRQVYAGNTVQRWRQEITSLRQIWAVWSACQQSDSAQLDTLLMRLEEDGPPNDYIDPSWSQDGLRMGRRIGYPHKFRSGYLLAPALRWIEAEIDLRLRDQVQPEFSLREVAHAFETQVSARNLISALWLQMADAIESESQFRECVECHKWFRVPTQGGKPKEYCSERCRIRAAKKRRKGRAQ